MGTTQTSGAQGGQSQLRVEVTGSYLNANSLNKHSISLLVLRALNVPYIKSTFLKKREYFVTLAYQATKKKTKKTKGVQVEGQTAVWNQMLDPLYDIPLFNLISR